MPKTRDYERVERAIQFIAARSPRQPSLAEVAEHIGLSEFHFQRLFSRWAGLSPKRFAQYLTVQHAKTLLRNSTNILDASYASGLSGSGRLHDLFVTVEAITPGEHRRQGAGLTIDYAIHDSPFGDLLVATTARGICGMYFLRTPGEPEPAVELLRAQWPAAELQHNPEAGGVYAARLFALDEYGDREPMPVLLNGTNFQVNVWRALLRIPAGSAVTYEQLAELSGTPSAIRAVGTAVGRNPLSYLIPCHRVIRKSGDFGNYGGGIERKKAMLAWESAHFDESQSIFTEHTEAGRALRVGSP